MNEEKDAQVIEERKPRRKKKNHKKGYLIVCFVILLIFGAFIIALNNVGLLDFKKIDLDLGKKEKVSLNYTVPNNKQKEGVYITDVSEVVEEVMPSIVAITSKTLVRSGNYGPSFFGQNQYSEGAGSGVIVSQTEGEILILTNNHVVEGAEELSVQFVNEKSADAVVKGTSEKREDTCLFRVLVIVI